MARFRTSRQRKAVMGILMAHHRKTKAVELKVAVDRQAMLLKMKGVLG